MTEIVSCVGVEKVVFVNPKQLVGKVEIYM